MPEVICFGEILWDIFEVRERGPEPISRHFRPELGGAPANVATGLARLGVRTALVGAVGQDRLGDALIAHLRADRVDVRGIVRLPNRTGLTFVVRDARGEPDFVFYRHESADVSIRAQHIASAAHRAVWVVVGTNTLMTRDLARATFAFLDAAERAGAHVMVDLNVRAHAWRDASTMQKAIASLAARASLVKASEADLRALGGRASKPFGWLSRHAGGAGWLVTRGSRSASAIGAHGIASAPAERARCVDATGAGDAFIAGSLAALIAAGSVPGSSAWRDAEVWRAVLRVGHMMGKKAVSQVGAVAGLKRLGRPRAAIERLRRSAP